VNFLSLVLCFVALAYAWTNLRSNRKAFSISLIALLFVAGLGGLFLRHGEQPDIFVAIAVAVLLLALQLRDYLQQRGRTEIDWHW
jgi:uncharacterized membrane protein (DUF4010 family)